MVIGSTYRRNEKGIQDREGEQKVMQKGRRHKRIYFPGRLKVLMCYRHDQMTELVTTIT